MCLNSRLIREIDPDETNAVIGGRWFKDRLTEIAGMQPDSLKVNFARSLIWRMLMMFMYRQEVTTHLSLNY